MQSDILTPDRIREITTAYYSCFCGTDISAYSGGIHFVAAPVREKAVKGYGCKIPVYILQTGDTCIVAYAPSASAMIRKFKNRDSAAQILQELSREYSVHQNQLMVFQGERLRDYGNARILEKADYSLYETFFRACHPSADPSGWLEAYYLQKAAAGFFAGYLVDDKLVCVSDAPDMPYMEGQIQHTGIETRQEERRKGYAKRTSALATHHLLEMGICPQWECDIGNEASKALARSIGYVDYGIAYFVEE